MGKLKDIKKLGKLLGDSNYIINSAVENIKRFLSTLDEDRTIGSIKDSEIKDYVIKKFNEMKK
jgi:hypothetical protein